MAGSAIPTLLAIALLIPGEAPTKPNVRSIALRGSAPGAGVGMDYLAFDPARKELWIPAGNTGRVDVLDTVSARVSEIPGFATAEREFRGKKRVIGPSSASVGDGVVYVGNRADSKICAIESESKKLGACLAIASSPDGLAYVEPAKELWVTTPSDRSITVLDASAPGALKAKLVIKLDGEPEGYAVDVAHKLFYTNLEDADRTLAIDVATHKVVSNWKTGCGEAGPRGLVVDAVHRWLFVACTDRVLNLDAAHDGKLIGAVPTGAGLDNIDSSRRLGLVVAAAGKDATLSVMRLEEQGVPVLVGKVPTAAGARCVVMDDLGRSYVADSGGGRILVVDPPACPPTQTPRQCAEAIQWLK
jgi:DNA-binding beta-propeller fold protein YncE